MKKIFLSIFIAYFGIGSLSAQNTFEEYLKASQQEYSQYKSNKDKEFEEFRSKTNAEYTRLMRRQWKEYNSEDAIPTPEKEPTPPVPIPAPIEEQTLPAKDNPIKIETVVKASPITKEEKPQPIVKTDPVQKEPTHTPDYVKGRHTFTFYGTSCGITWERGMSFSLKSVEENDVANVWEHLCDNNAYAQLVKECISIREEMNLCDWGYLLLSQTVCESVLGNSGNETTLLQAFILNQSGYKIRIARSPEEQLFLLVASNYTIYDKKYFILDNERFYLIKSYSGKRLKIFDRKFPNDCALDMTISNVPKFTRKFANKRTLTSKRYPEVSITLATNRNLIDFYNDYPSSAVVQNENSKWSIYAQVPLSFESRALLYPTLKKAIAGKTEAEAANILLNFVQTAFTYEYDNKIWGKDRIFAADETLYYPYSDCEDRSILFSRLVRDLLGLDVILIYYPGHLATAVKFNQNITGDHLILNGKRYLVCDPTFIGASIGRTMTGMDNHKAQVIML